MTRSQDVKM